MKSASRYAVELAGRYGFEYDFHPYWPGQPTMQVMNLKLQFDDEIFSTHFAWCQRELEGWSEDRIHRCIAGRFSHAAEILWRTVANGLPKVKVEQAAVPDAIVG